MLSAPRPRQGYGSAGFSLIEVVVTLVIIGIAVSLAMPSITEWIQNGQIRTASESVKNGLQFARMEAVKTNSPVAFVLANPGNVGGTGWTVTRVLPNVTTQSKPDGEGSNNVTLNTTPAGATTVTFTGLGRRQATNADGSGVLTMIEANSSTPANPRPLHVTISLGGEIRTCDPGVTDTGDPRAC